MIAWDRARDADSHTDSRASNTMTTSSTPRNSHSSLLINLTRLLYIKGCHRAPARGSLTRTNQIIQFYLKLSAIFPRQQMTRTLFLRPHSSPLPHGLEIRFLLSAGFQCDISNRCAADGDFWIRINCCISSEVGHMSVGRYGYSDLRNISHAKFNRTDHPSASFH